MVSKFTISDLFLSLPPQTMLKGIIWKRTNKWKMVTKNKVVRIIFIDILKGIFFNINSKVFSNKQSQG